MKLIVWHRSTYEDLIRFPEDVQDEIGYALDLAQRGDTYKHAKPLRGMNGVIEVVSRFDTNTYRAAYYTKVLDKVIVLHCFQKKSKHGIATPKHEVNLIKQRLKEVKKEYAYH